MSDSKQTPPAKNPLPLWRQMLKSAQLMAFFIVLGVGLLIAAYKFTKEDIAQAEKEMLLQTFQQVLSPNLYNNHPLEDTLQVSSQKLLGSAEPITVYRARMNQQPAAVILETVAPDGYSGNIHLLIAVLHDGRVAGVRTLKHKETPGLGDKIELQKSKWILDFQGRSLRDDNFNNWAVKKDGGMFDQFTGATITPRAVVKAIRNALIFVNNQGDKLYE